MLKILIVDPDAARADVLRANLDFLEFESEVVDHDQLLTKVAGGGADVVMIGPCSETVPDMLELFRRLRERDSHLPVIRLALEDEPEPPSDVETGSTATITLPPRFGEVQAALHAP